MTTDDLTPPHWGAPDTPAIEQSDRDAAARFISPSDGDLEELAGLFARHRLAERERCARLAETAELERMQWGAGRPNFEKGREAAAAAIRNPLARFAKPE